MNARRFLRTSVFGILCLLLGNAAPAQTFNLPSAGPAAGVIFNSDGTVTFFADLIDNDVSQLGGASGVLELQLWATTQPFGGIAKSGYLMATSAPLGQLLADCPGGAALGAPLGYPGVTCAISVGAPSCPAGIDGGCFPPVELALTNPPVGTYYLAMGRSVCLDRRLLHHWSLLRR